MKTCYLDANVLVYYKDPSSAFNAISKNIIRKLIEEGWIISISSLAIGEFLYALIGLLKIANKKNYFTYLTKYLGSLLAIPNLKIVNPPENLEENNKIVNLMKKYQLSPRDSYHLLIMQTHKISHFATFDADFEKVFKSKIVSLYKI